MPPPQYPLPGASPLPSRLPSYCEVYSNSTLPPLDTNVAPLQLLTLLAVALSQKTLGALSCGLIKTGGFFNSRRNKWCEITGLCGSPGDGSDDGGIDWSIYDDASELVVPGWQPQRDPSKVPDFVLDSAPYVWLYSGEQYMPCSIDEHLQHTHPFLDYSSVASDHPSLDELSPLNKHVPHMYLTSDDDPEGEPPLPAWLTGSHNTPSTNTTSFLPADPSHRDGFSSAPMPIFWIEKGPRVIDAFYFYFYSFNLGNTVAGWRFGNHVGDWEHSMIRFVDGKPHTMFFSEHTGGAAFRFDAVEHTAGGRPIVYSAEGSHANYATPGTHYYAIPFHLLADHTDRGFLWDIKLNNLVYNYAPSNSSSGEPGDGGDDGDTDSNDPALPPRDGVLTPDMRNQNASTDWFFYQGRWGDRRYPLEDDRQYTVAGQYKYVSGPTGPIDKNLARRRVCTNEEACRVREGRDVEFVEVRDGSWELEQWEQDMTDEEKRRMLESLRGSVPVGAGGGEGGARMAGDAGMEL